RPSIASPGMGSPEVSVLLDIEGWPEDARRFLASLARHSGDRPVEVVAVDRRLEPDATLLEGVTHRHGGARPPKAELPSRPPRAGRARRAADADRPRHTHRAWEATPEAERGERSRRNMGVVHEVFFGRKDLTIP